MARLIDWVEGSNMGGSFQHILVAEDDELVRNMISEMLTLMGLPVSSAKNGSQGLDLFLKNTFDLVITDYYMPGMNGMDFASIIKKNSPLTMVLLITAGRHGKIETTESTTIVDHILLKPFTFDKFKDTIRKLSEQRLDLLASIH